MLALIIVVLSDRDLFATQFWAESFRTLLEDSLCLFVSLLLHTNAVLLVIARGPVKLVLGSGNCESQIFFSSSITVQHTTTIEFKMSRQVVKTDKNAPAVGPYR